MRIITKGVVEKTWPRKFVANCCKSVLEILPDDIKEDTDYTGGHNSWYIDCPACGGQPDIPDETKYAGRRWLEQQERIGNA